MVNALAPAANQPIDLTLPDALGTLQIHVRDHTSIALNGSLLLGAMIYGLQANMAKRGDTWYFLNGSQIGLPGSRPAPKQTQAVLKTVAAVTNDFLRGNQEVEQIIAAKSEQQRRRKLASDYHDLRRRATHTANNIRDRQIQLEYALKDAAEAQAALEAFQLEHPDIHDD